MGLREPLRDVDCGLPAALEVMGERWSFMILRAAFNEVSHFEEFLEPSSASPATSSPTGSASWSSNGVLKREPCPEDRRKVEYRLTEKGPRPAPGDARAAPVGREVHRRQCARTRCWSTRRTGCRSRPIGIRAHDGRDISYFDLRWCPADNVGQPCEGLEEAERALAEKRGH